MDPVLASIPALPCILSCEIKKGYWEKKEVDSKIESGGKVDLIIKSGGEVGSNVKSGVEVDSKIELAGMGIGRHRQAPEISFILFPCSLPISPRALHLTTYVFPCTTWDIIPVGPGHL